MKVGLVSPYDLSSPGGVQAQVFGLADRLAAMGDKPVIIGPGLPADSEGVDLGRSVRVPGNGSMAPISIDPRVLSRLRKASADVDVLHVHEPLMPLASLAANQSGPPVVATFHADPPRWVRGVYGLSRRLIKSALGKTKSITAVSMTAASALPSGLEVTIVPNGVDIGGVPSGVKRNPTQVAFLGRDERRKGLDILLDAWPIVIDAVPDAELVVMGAVRQTSGVNWLGRVENPKKFEVLAGSAIYVAPNTGGESFGIVLVEAMANGTAVVASNLAAFKDVAGDDARYFAIGDSGVLAGTLVDLLHDHRAREDLGKRGLTRVQQFDWDTVAQTYRDIYASVMP